VTSDTISKFNRDTVWLATGVLGTVVFAALVLVVQECQPKPNQVESALLANVDLERAGSALARVPGSKGKMTPGQETSLGQVFSETAILRVPSSQTRLGAATSALPLPPTDRPGAQANRDAKTSVRLADSSRNAGLKVRNARNKRSWASKAVDVKKRLIELWHLSLARSAKARSWTAFSNLQKGASKKAAYTAETRR
jgi:hypothetical protein